MMMLGGVFGIYGTVRVRFFLSLFCLSIVMQYSMYGTRNLLTDIKGTIHKSPILNFYIDFQNPGIIFEKFLKVSLIFVNLE